MSDDAHKLLVVDDEPFNRNLIRRQLEKEGYADVEEAENGRQAIEMLENEAFDLVLLDIEMPEIDGFGVLERMNSDMRLRHVPVIIISASEGLESIVRCIELGAEDHLPKPFNATLLKARLGASLEKKRLRDMEASYLDQIKTEKKRSDSLLNVILPAAAANELKATGEVKPRSYENAALLFCDIVGFTSYCDYHSPEEVVNGLQALIARFEARTNEHEMEKIKTIGDAYMASAGLMKPNGDPLLSAVRCGLAMISAVAEVKPEWQVRVGAHAGPVVAGIVGDQKYQFDVWGDTVNIAARMASNGNPGVVTLTHESWMDVQDECLGRMVGKIEIKGKGPVEVVEAYGVK